MVTYLGGSILITIFALGGSIVSYNLHVCDDYSDFPLPILHDETKWAAWAQNLISIEPFMSAGVPSPYKDVRKKDRELAFKNWEEWAKKAYLVMLTQDNN